MLSLDDLAGDWLVPHREEDFSLLAITNFHGVASVLRMPAGANAFVERLTFERSGTFYLVFLGLPRVWRFTDDWNLPPEDPNS